MLIAALPLELAEEPPELLEVVLPELLEELPPELAVLPLDVLRDVDGWAALVDEVVDVVEAAARLDVVVDADEVEWKITPWTPRNSATASPTTQRRILRTRRTRAWSTGEAVGDGMQRGSDQDLGTA